MLDSKAQTFPKQMTNVTKRFRELIDMKTAAFDKVVSDECRRKDAHALYGPLPLDTTCLHFGQNPSRDVQVDALHRDMVVNLHISNGSLEFHSAELEYYYEKGFDDLLKQARKIAAELSRKK